MQFSFFTTTFHRIQSAFFWCIKKWRTSLVILLGVIASVFVFAQIVSAVKEEHIYVFPVQVEVSGWESPEHAFVQDLSSHAEVPDFTKENSAFLHVESREATSTEGGVIGEEIIPSATDVEVPNTPEEIPSDALPPQEDIPVVAPSSDSPILPVEQPSIQDEAFTPAFYLLPRAHAEVVGATTTDEVTARCKVLGRECRTMLFSGFSLGGALDASLLESATLGLSLGGQVRSRGVLSVSYRIGGEWKIAGETVLEGDISNQLRGGYVSLPVPEIESWQALDTMEVLVEFVAEDSASREANEIFLDALWLDVGYEESEEVDLSGIPNIETGLTKSDQELRVREADTLRVGEKLVTFEAIPEAVSDGILLKVDRPIAIGLRSAEYLVSLTNTTDQDLSPSLSLLSLPDTFTIDEAYYWDTTRTETRSTPVTGVTGYYCESGWSPNASSSDIFSCSTSGEERLCDARNDDATNCIVENDQVGTTNTETIVPGWTALLPRPYTEVSAFATLLGQYEAQSAITEDVVGAGTIPLDRILASGETAYMRVRVTFDENTTGKLSVFASGDTGASAFGSLAWDALWTRRIPVSITGDDDAGELGVVTRISIDASQQEFWEEVRADGGDIRLVDDEAGIEIPFGITRFDYEGKHAEVWGRLSTLRPAGTSTLYVYFGNPHAERVDNLLAVLSTDTPTPRSIVLGENEGAVSVDVMGYDHATQVRVGEGEIVSLDRGEVRSLSRVLAGEILSATGPITASLPPENTTHLVVPLSLAGKTFVIPETEQGREVFLSAIDSPVSIVLWNGPVGSATGSLETITLSPRESSKKITLPEGTVMLAGDDAFVVALRGKDGTYPTAIAPLEKGEFVGLMRDRMHIGTVDDASAYRVRCTSGQGEEKDGRRGGETFDSVACVGGLFSLADVFHVSAPLSHSSVITEDREVGGFIGAAPVHHGGNETIIPAHTKAVTVACIPGGESSWEMRRGDGSLIRVGSCAPGSTRLEQETVVSTDATEVFAPGLSVRTLGTTSDPVFVFAEEALSGGEVGVSRMSFFGGEVSSRGYALGVRATLASPERVFPHDRRENDRDIEGNEIHHINELLSEARDFSAKDIPEFRFRFSPRTSSFLSGLRDALGMSPFSIEKLSLVHSTLGAIDANIEVVSREGDEWTVRIVPKSKVIRPGKYTLQMEVNDNGEILTDAFDFYWGMLAVNTDQSEYAPDSDVLITAGALTNSGNTICDARLRAQITRPDGTKDDLDLPPSGFCNGNNVTSVPDYFAQYHATSTGTYALQVVEVDAGGVLINEIRDTFVVSENIPFSIRRSGPTRIYPLALYDMKIAITAREDFEGSLIERIEKDFVVTDRGGAFLEDQGDYISATWNIGLKAGETQEFTYRFDAPNISPFRFHLGPASLTKEETVAYVELRTWQIASDAAGQMMLFWDDGASVPAGWTCVSCAGGDPFSGRYALGASTYGTQSGSTTHSHSASSSVVGTAVNDNGSAATLATENTQNNLTIAGLDHLHNFDPVISSTTSLPLSRSLRIIRSNTAGDVALPVGAIAIFDVASSSLPTDWYRYAPQDGYFIYSSTTVGTVLGSSTHTHVISSSTDNGVGIFYRQRNSGTQVTGAVGSHQHRVNATTTLTNHEPSYLEVVLAKLSVATGTTNGMITMWNDTPAAGWITVSDSGGAFNGKYLKASTTYGGSGGALTHIPPSLSATTSSSTNNINARQLAPLAGLSSSHFHVVDLSFSEVENLPPSTDVIFAKRSSGISAYTQLDFQFYANTNAITPTDPWPAGGIELLENEAGSDVTTSIRPTQIMRLRMNMLSSNATTSVGLQAWKLQYSASADCATALNWNDVASSSSSTAAWRGYNNTGVAQNANLPSLLLSTSTVAESYVEENSAAVTPVEIPLNGVGEWDWVVQHNTALANTNYCFRMVKSDGSLLDVYSNYPSILTNQTPDASELSAPFNNESVGTTTPSFEFAATDPEDNDVDYEIVVDDDPNFGSPILNYTSLNDPDLFTNVPNPTNKSPFFAGDTIRYKATVALTASTTYWWRVRAIDSSGSNTYGAWSTSRSVTIDLSVGVARWYQTTAEQFQTDTFEGTNASSSVNNYVTLTTGSTTGTTTSSAIVFSEAATGTAWGGVTWNRDLPGGLFLVRVEYYTSTGSWAYIPDTDLPGNSSGFNTSPISLLTVNPDSYETIRLRADFTAAGGFGPRLLDWTVNWAFLVNTPTLYKLFDNEKTNTTTPSFEFSTTDPQGESLTYEFQWSTSPSFTSSTTRSSAAHAGFTDLSTGDTNPFNSGDRIRFTIQGADALIASTTYWWRVRAVDPSPGSGTFSFYSDARSFTVDLSVNVPTWFQTTLGQFDTDALTGAETFSGDAVRVATTSREAMIVYGEGTVQTPRYRLWTGTAWGNELSALTIGAQVKWASLKGSPVSGEYMLGTVGSDKDTNIQIYSGGAWGNQTEVSDNISNSDARGLDIAWETLTGEAMAVSCDVGNEPIYTTWDGESWSTATATVAFGATTTCEWISLASDPASDEIILMMRNTGSRYYAGVWNGSSWSSTTSLGQMVETNNEGMAVEYEESGDQAIIVVSTPLTAATQLQSKFWNGTSWSTASSTTIGAHIEFGSLKRDIGSDSMALCYVDNQTDVGVLRWDGNYWRLPFFEPTTVGNAKTARPVDCEFENTAGRNGYIMVPYSTTASGFYQVWNGTAWLGAGLALTTMQDSAVVQARRTTDNLILSVFFNDADRRYDFSYWDGTTWSLLQTLESSPSDTAAPHRETFMIAPKLPATIGTIVSDPIDFDDGVSPAWDSVLWSATTTGSSSVAIQVEYLTSSSSWALVPDTDLPGNSVGDTSTATPISLINLNTETYDQIRLKATLTCIVGNCPTLNDWTVKWAEGIDLSGTAKQFDLTSNVTSGTVAVAVNGTIQVGKTGSISGGTWSIDNVTVFPGNVVTVFVDGASDANEAVNVARYVGPGDFGGLRLNERHLTIGSASSTATTTTNLDLSRYDNSVSADEDVFHDVDASSDLLVCSMAPCGGAGLVVAYGTYRPDSSSSGNVDTYDIHINSTTTADGNTFNVGGNWDNNFVFSANTGSVVFTATSGTRTIDSTGATTATFNNTTFGSGSGSSLWNLSSPLAVAGDLTVNFGTLSPGSASTTIDGNLTFGASGGFQKGTATTTFGGSVSKTWTDNTTAKQDLGLVAVDGTSKTINLGSAVRATNITIGANDTLDVTTGNFGITVLGDWVNNNVFNARSGTTTFAGGAGALRTISPGTSPFHHLYVNGTSSWSFSTAGATTTGTVTIATGTLALPSGTFSVGGGFQNTGGAFTGGTTVKFTSTASGNKLQAGTSSWPELLYTGSGSFAFQDTNATTTGSVFITAGTVTLPSGTFALPRAFDALGGAFAANSGTIKLTATSSAFTLRGNGSSFATLLFAGGGSWNMLDTNATTTGTFQITSGTTTLPSGVLAVGGSFLNADKFTHASGTVKLISSSLGNSVTAGNSLFGNLEFRSSTGGWTITGNATTTGTLTLRSAGAFTQSSGTTLETRGTFSNQVGGASTTWSGSRLWLNSSSSYSINATSTGADVYGIFAIGANTQVRSWNSTSTSYELSSSASLYSQDHNAVDGELYIFGNYTRTSGTDYWNYATDFDGTVLSGGARRQASVKFASSATSSFTGASLQIVGDTLASTTVTNQGSGTYGIVLSGGTINADSYVFRNLGNQGLQLLATTTITALAHGDFELAVAGGTLITMSSTTVDRNQGLQIDQVRFATTTVITGNNVTELGTATSSVRFRFHYGNLAGEAFDNDPAGNPGNIRWDDSNYIISISGTVYSDAGVTPLGAPVCDDVTSVVRVKVENGGDFTAPCSSGVATGTFTVSGVTFSGDLTFTIYLDTDGTATSGAVITKSATEDITGLNIYQSRVIVRHEDVSPITITDMNAWDFEDESDLPFEVSTSGTPTLLVHANTEFWIWAGETFTPGGNMTISSGGSGYAVDGKFHLDNGATFVGSGSETHTFGGSWQADSGSTFTGGGSDWIANGTSTGKLITAVPTVTFETLTLNGTGGEWSMSGNFTVSSGLTITAGTLAGTANLTVSSGGILGNGVIAMTGGTVTSLSTANFGGNSNWSFSGLTFGNGSVATTTKIGSGAITTSGVLTVSANTVLEASNTLWTLLSSGTPITVAGTLSPQTSTFRYATTTAMNIRALPYYRLELAPLGSGSPTYTMLSGTLSTQQDLVVGDGVNAVTVTANTNDPTLSVSGDLTISTSTTLIGSNTGSFTVGGSWTTTGTYTHSAGTVTFNATTLGKTISASTSPFGAVNFNSASGGWTVLGNATTSGAFSLTQVSSFVMASGTTLEVRGTFTNGVGGASTTWTGTVLHLNSGTSYSANTKTTGSDIYDIFRVGTATDVKIWNSNASSVLVLTTGSLYSQDHAGVDGALNIWGDYVRSSGTEYWSSATDFDGVVLGTPRQVNVRLASGTAVALTSGGWEIYGSSTATTTIDREGSVGAYALRIQGGSTTAQYYQLRNADANGLDISGAPIINNISDGDFEVAQGGGAGMTVSASAIDANPLKISFRNRFATTTAISAYNVRATGSSTSAWRFSAHLASTTANGNLGGEYFDSDPGGDPGMLIWDDSAANVTISGVVYADSGVTPIGSPVCDNSTHVVRLRVQGIGTYTAYCDSGTGLYSIQNVIFNPGDTLTVYLDTAGVARGATVSFDPATNITNMDIYRDTVIVRHEGLSPLSISNMDQYDFNNDPDIPFSASLGAPNTLSVFSGTELRVWNGKVFAPNGNVTVHGNASTTQLRDGAVIVESGATFQAAGSESHTFGGRFTVTSSGVFTAANSSVTFNATTTGKVISPSTSSFYNLLFTGLGGSWSLGSTATATNNVTLSGGTVDLPTALFAVGGSFTKSGSIASFTSATGSVTKFFSTATGKTIQSGTSTWSNLLFHGVGGGWTFSDTNATATESVTIATGTATLPVGTLMVGGDFQNTGGVITANQSSSLKMTATTTATVRMGGSSLGQLLFTGGGTYSMTDTNATTTGSVRIISGTTTLPSGILEVRQSFVNSDTFIHASGTLKMTGTTTGYSITGGNSQFGNLEFANSGGGWTMTGNATTSGAFSLRSANTFTQTSGTTLEIRGAFTNLAGGASTTWTGTRLYVHNGQANYTINSKTQGGDLYNILRLSPLTQLRSWNSSASTYEVDATASLYSQDHAGVDGNLYIFGDYNRTSGADYWSYATDFDGVALGGSSRAVTVRHASDATSTYTGATLQIVGAIGATTTVTNQGSGVYHPILTDVALSANYFAFRNLATSGLQLLGASTLSSFQNGDFELAVSGGSLITIAATTIDQNASNFFSRIRFATSTAITGHNVTRIGTSSAAITFQSHYGNLGGEGFDDDGGDACGQLRFDDSACLFVDQPHYRWRNDDGGEGVPSSEWYDVNWSKRKRITVTNPNGSAVTNASVKFDVEFDSDMQADFDDIRFTDSTGTTSLSYWFEEVNASATSTAWVEIPSLATGETVIYMYYGNNTAPSVGSGTSTFMFFDDFEDGSLSEYSGDTSLFSSLATMNYERTRGLGASAGNENGQTTDGIGQASLGLGRDTTFRFFQYIDMTAGPSNESCALFGVQSPLTSNQNYAVCLQPFGSDKLTIASGASWNGRPASDGATLLVSKAVTWSTGWYETEVDWLSDNTIYVSVYDSGGTLFATTSTSSATYTSGGIGFVFWGQHGGWDIPSVRPYTASEPTTVFGPEQINGGASWKALIDTILEDQLPNQNVRLRLEVENSGSPITNQNFELEVAPKGASPNCESVSSGSYSAVPPSSSCGSAVACMSASSEFTDHAPTSDLLSVPTGSTFVAGEMLEDTSNQTNPLDLTGTEYTEVEYNFQLTNYASANSYCFRTTNNGTPLDNYSRVAEVTVLYPPSISEYHFNSDQHIALVEGATTTIYATGTASDLNGYADLSFATSTMHRSGVGQMCTADQNNCYQVASTSCSFSNCSGNSCQFSCSADLYYFADPTDVGSPYDVESWYAVTDIVDSSLSRARASSSQEVYTLRGFTASNTIAYGSVTVGQNTGTYNPTTTIRNTGNSVLNLLVSGTDMTNGSSTIAAANQKYATSSFTYSSCVGCSTLSSTTPQAFNINLAKPTTTTAVTSLTYWGINVPLMTAATTHSGSNTLTAN